MTRRTNLYAVAAHLRALATQLEQHGYHDRSKSNVGLCRCLYCRADLLAARGWPTNTGATGSRSADGTSSTERAAGVLSDGRRPLPPRHADIDIKFVKQVDLLWHGGQLAATTIRNLLTHAPDDDHLPAGSGECPRCGHFCRPDRDANDRIRSGYCRKCHRRWVALGKPDRSAYSRSLRRLPVPEEDAA